MKALDSFTVEEIEEIISSCQQEIHNTPTSDEFPVSPRLLLSLARIALAAKRAEPDYYILRLEYDDAWGGEILFSTYETELEAIKSKSDHGGEIIPAYTTPQLNSPEIHDYKSSLLGLLMSCISKDHLGFFTLAGINKTNLIKAVEVSGATINFDYVPQVNIGECLIPKGWRITQEIPEGWKLVPIIAYPSQWAAGQKAHNSAGINKVDAVYKAMVAAAPNTSGFDPSLPGAEATVITHYHTPDGYKLVPTELTKAMRDAWDSAPNGHEDDDVNMCNAYRAMIAAAPEKPL